ncbi:hypothetical protein FRUB_08649 [Fimbriiglobus ruber]|uniref:Uncharacterized protein n=1 Tax=Fimbriiglobus ruber TaxID=1908690 RepID=A0A225DFF8_9BACT|nr:hypothetical protein FRUB_08649 [Fimbriiglobus ruber]
MAFSVVWVRPGEVLFVSQFGERPRPRSGGGAFLRNDYGGLLFGNLTPFGYTAVGAPWPVAVSPVGIVAGSSATEPPFDGLDDVGGCMSFGDIKSATHDGRTLLVNGRPFVSCKSPALAARWTGWLTELKALPPEDREQRIVQALTRSYDPVEAGRVFASCREQTTNLRRASQVLFGYCYLAFAGLLLGYLTISLSPIFIGYGMLILLTFYEYRRATRAVGRPDAEKAGWMLLVSPADAFRAADKLVRSIVDEFHPAAIGVGVAGMTANDSFVRRAKLDLLYPRPRPRPRQAVDRRAAEVVDWFTTVTQTAIADKLGGVELNAPEREVEAIMYCPRCEMQYIRAGTCPACAIPLKPFAAPVTVPPPKSAQPGSARPAAKVRVRPRHRKRRK